MSESRAEKYRYWLTYLLEDLPVGAKFHPDELHVTVITWFVIDTPEDGLIKSFYERFSGRKAFGLALQDEVSLGPREDVSVFLLDPTPEILSLHADGLNWFEEVGARWAVKNPFMGDEYKPHIRRREGMSLKTGDQIRVNSLTLVKALRRADDERIVAAKVVLK